MYQIAHRLSNAELATRACATGSASALGISGVSRYDASAS